MISQELLPNWQTAERHAHASNIGKCPKNLLDPQLCECCLNPIEKEPISLGANIKHLHFLGLGVPLFFHFLQGCIILNLLLVVTDNLPSLMEARAYSQKVCEAYYEKRAASQSHHIISVSLGLLPMILRSQVRPQFQFSKADDSLRVQCTKLLVYNAQIARELSVQQKISRVCSFFIHACCLIFIKSQIIKRKHYFNEVYHHLADYSVIVKEMDPEVNDKATKMRNYIMSLQDKYNTKYDLQRVLLIPENQLLEVQLVKEEELLGEYLQLREHKSEQAEEKWAQLANIRMRIEDQVARTKEELLLQYNPTQSLILIFERKINKIQFLNKVPEILADPLFAFFFGRTDKVVIEGCPNPKEVMWTNLKYSSDRPFKIFFGWFLSFLFLSFTFVLFYMLQTYKTQFIREAFFMNSQSGGAQKRKRKAMIVAWGTWLGIIVYNKFILAPVLEYFTKLQKHDKVSNQDFSLAFKYAWGMFFTSSIMKIVVETTQFNNYYRQDFGIIEEESLMFIFSALFLPLLWLVHPNRLLHLIKRWVYYSRSCVTQAQANFLMAEYPYMIGKRYAEIIEMMWFTYLYTELIPLGGILMLFGQCIYYWIDKYNLLRRSSLNYTVGVALSDKMLKLLDLTLFWRFLGSFIFDWQLRNYLSWLTVVMLFVSIAYVLLPWEQILDYFDYQQFHVSEIPYSVLKKTQFRENDYYKVHPIKKYLDCRVLLKRRTSQLSL